MVTTNDVILDDTVMAGTIIDHDVPYVEILSHGEIITLLSIGG